MVNYLYKTDRAVPGHFRLCEEIKKSIEFLIFRSIMLQRKEKNRWLGMKKLFFIIFIR